MFALAALFVCQILQASPPERVLPGPRPDGVVQLPNGRTLTPAGTQTSVKPYPFALVPTPDGKRVVVASMGSGYQALQVLDVRDGKLLFSLPVDKSWLGLAVSPDGKTVYLSGASHNAVLVYWLEDDRLSPAGEISVRTPEDGRKNPIPSGLAITPDGGALWVARLMADDLVRVDLKTGKVDIVVPAGRHPYRPVLSPDGKRLVVASWGGATVLLLDAGTGRVIATIPTEDHPCDVVFSPDGQLLYVAQANRNRVAIVDVRLSRVVRQVDVGMAPEGPGAPSASALPDGSTPNALALSSDGRTLYVANADDDAVAVVSLARGPAEARTVGFIPTGWYPAALGVPRGGKTLLVANAKGSGSRSNREDGPRPTLPGKYITPGSIRYLPGSVSRIPLPSPRELDVWTRRAYANRKPVARGVTIAKSKIPPIKYVFYVIRENRTYDQVLGDVSRGNGDPSLVLFGLDVTPNAHALAGEFVLFDNFYADAEVSADGHSWSTAAYATDFTEKAWPANYGGMGVPYLFEGDDATAAPTAGYLWDAAARASVPIRNYGEFVGTSTEKEAERFEGSFDGKVAHLEGNTCPFYPGFDLDILDNTRVDLWLKEFRGYERDGNLPRLSILRLGNDHTAGTKRASRTPRAMVAENDLALGRFVEAVSHSAFWGETAIFVVEDDAQNGADHVDSHRTVAFVISPYTRRGGAVDSTLYSTTSMLRTMELALGLPPLSQHDASATPMTNAFSEEPDPTPFRHREASVPLFEMNPEGAPLQAAADSWDFSRADAAPDLALNEAIWRSLKGCPMPAPVNSPWRRGAPADDADNSAGVK